MLEPRNCGDYNCSATTGIPNPVGDYRGPEKNPSPNPGGYWWGMVLVKNRGWAHVQKIGRKATEKAMLALGADVNSVPVNAGSSVVTDN